MTKKLNRIAITTAGFGTVLGSFLVAAVSKAADYTASTTAAITDAGESVLDMFFTNLPIILTFVVGVIITLWGIRWVLSLFRGGRR